MSELPKPVFLKMIETGALTPGKDDKSFDVDFAVVQKHFPSYLEFMVRHSLNQAEEWAYVQGYMTYEVLPSGLLAWKPTGKRFKP